MVKFEVFDKATSSVYVLVNSSHKINEFSKLNHFLSISPLFLTLEHSVVAAAEYQQSTSIKFKGNSLQNDPALRDLIPFVQF